MLPRRATVIDENVKRARKNNKKESKEQRVAVLSFCSFYRFWVETYRLLTLRLFAFFHFGIVLSVHFIKLLLLPPD